MCVYYIKPKSETDAILNDWIRMYGTEPYIFNGEQCVTAYYLDPSKRFIVATRPYPLSISASGDRSKIQAFHDESRDNTSLLTIERAELMPTDNITENNLPVNVQQGININIEDLEKNKAQNMPPFLEGWDKQLASKDCSTLRKTLDTLKIADELKKFYTNGVIVKESQWNDTSSSNISSASGVAQFLTGTAQFVGNIYEIGTDRQDPIWNGKAVIANLDMTLEYKNNKELFIKAISSIPKRHQRRTALFILGQAHHMGQGRLNQFLNYFITNADRIENNSANALDFYYKMINAFYDQGYGSKSEQKEGRMDVIKIVAFETLAQEPTSTHLTPPPPKPQSPAHTTTPTAPEHTKRTPVRSPEKIRIPACLASPTWTRQSGRKKGKVETFTKNGRRRTHFPHGLIDQKRPVVRYKEEICARITIPYVNIDELMQWLTAGSHSAAELKKFNGLDEDTNLLGETIRFPISWIP